MAVSQTQPSTSPTRSPDRLGGVAGNQRLTAELGAVLFVLLAALGFTIPSVRSLMYAHVFLGLLLIPPVGLKLASTGYRFARYYTGDRAYRLAGPPAPLQRMIAPFVVLATVAVFASGVMLLVLGPGAGIWRNLHKAAFLVWFGVTTVHVLSYVTRVPGLAAPDWRPDDTRLGGSGLRRLLVLGSVAVGVLVAAVGLPYASAWTSP